jgi:hypothetical protein
MSGPNIDEYSSSYPSSSEFSSKDSLSSSDSTSTSYKSVASNETIKNAVANPDISTAKHKINSPPSANEKQQLTSFEMEQIVSDAKFKIANQNFLSTLTPQKRLLLAAILSPEEIQQLSNNTLTPNLNETFKKPSEENDAIFDETFPKQTE